MHSKQLRVVSSQTRPDVKRFFSVSLADRFHWARGRGPQAGGVPQQA